MWLRLLTLAKTLGPGVAKTLTQLWPLLAKSQKAQDITDKLLSRFADVGKSPSREDRLAAVRSVLEEASTAVTTPERKDVVESWSRRVDALRLGIPLLDFGSPGVRRQRRKSWDTQFEKLVSDILVVQSGWSDDGGPAL
jgi:hypothetical protein